MKKENKMSYSFHVSIERGEYRDLNELPDAERKEILQRIGKQFIENGLQGTVINT